MKSGQRKGDAEQNDLLNKRRLLEDEIRVLKGQLERSLEGVSDYQKKHDALQISLMDVSVKAAQSSTYAVQGSQVETTLYENVDNTQNAANASPLKPQRSAPAIPSKDNSNVSDVKDTSDEKAANQEKKEEKSNNASDKDKK